MNCIKLNSLFSLALIGLVACEGGMSDYDTDSADTGEFAVYEDTYVPAPSEEVEELVEVGLASAFGVREIDRDDIEQSRSAFMMNVENEHGWQGSETWSYYTLAKIGFKVEEDMRLLQVTARIIGERVPTPEDGITPNLSPATDWEFCFVHNDQNIGHDMWSDLEYYFVLAEKVDANGFVHIPFTRLPTMNDTVVDASSMVEGVDLKKGEILTFNVSCSLKKGNDDAPRPAHAYALIVEQPKNLIVVGTATHFQPAEADQIRFPAEGVNVGSKQGATITPMTSVILH